MVFFNPSVLALFYASLVSMQPVKIGLSLPEIGP